MTTNSPSIGPISTLPCGEAAQAARKTLAAMLLASAASMVAWSFAVPAFEGPDEPGHWQYAYYLNQKHTLPVYGPSYPEADS
jgi:hypothetical protein